MKKIMVDRGNSSSNVRSYIRHLKLPPAVTIEIQVFLYVTKC